MQTLYSCRSSNQWKWSEQLLWHASRFSLSGSHRSSSLPRRAIIDVPFSGLWEPRVSNHLGPLGPTHYLQSIPERIRHADNEPYRDLTPLGVIAAWRISRTTNWCNRLKHSMLLSLTSVPRRFRWRTVGSLTNESHILATSPSPT